MVSLQEWPRQTKPKNASSWTFPGGIPEQKFNVNRAFCFPRKNTRIHKNGRNSWTSRFGPFFGLVCRGDSWSVETCKATQVCWGRSTCAAGFAGAGWRRLRAECGSSSRACDGGSSSFAKRPTSYRDPEPRNPDIPRKKTENLPVGPEPRFHQAEKRAQRLTFWVRRRPGGVGVFHSKGWWPKTSYPPSKVCLPWVSKRGIWDVPGILLGCPGPLGVFKKLVQKNFVRIFVPYSKKKREAFLLTDGAFLLTVELLCLQSIEVLLRHAFPL